LTLLLPAARQALGLIKIIDRMALAHSVFHRPVAFASVSRMTVGR
jgi:hypothetical protein